MAEGRKVVYFLGAGASLAAGAYFRGQGSARIPIPTAKDFWATFFRLARRPDRKKRVEAFLFRYFLGYARVPSRLSPSDRRKELAALDVEEVFTFLSERVAAPSTEAGLRRYFELVWEDLIGEVGYVFSRFRPNHSTRKIVRRFARRHLRAWDVVVSFNYDLIFESSLPKQRSWHYSELEARASGLRVLKPHGSVNWSLESGSLIRRSQPKAPMIVAPTHLKFVAHGQGQSARGEMRGYLNQCEQVPKIWTQMERHMREAKALVFVGYSFPVSDLYFASIMRSVLARRNNSPGFVIVNPDAIEIAKRLSSRFALSERTVTYFDFNQFITAGREAVLQQFES